MICSSSNSLLKRNENNFSRNKKYNKTSKNGFSKQMLLKEQHSFKSSR